MATRTEATERVAIALPLEPESAAQARAALAPLRPLADPSSFDDVTLMVSELVADALTAGGRPADAAIELEAAVRDGVTRVNVRFDDIALRIPGRRPAPAGPGWGVHLVQTLASRWGARRDGVSTYIWFEA